MFLAELRLNSNYRKGFFLIFLMAISTFTLIPFLSPFSVKNIGIHTTDLKYLYLVGGFFTIFTARLFGQMTDKHGAYTVLSTIVLFSSVPIYLYTNAPPMSLGLYLCLTTFFMTIVSGRMIPCMTLISSIPEPRERGSFMGVMNSIRSLGSATATLIAGMIITETENGQLQHFEKVGYLSISMIVMILIFARTIFKSHLQR